MHLLRRLCFSTGFLFVLGCIGFAQPSPTNSADTAVVSGVVKIGETPAANITLTLNPSGGGGNRPGGNFNAPQATNNALRVTTDAGGNYSFTNVPAGQYRLVAQADAFIGTRSEPITVTAAQTVKAPDLTLTRGGVITGRITGLNERPLIAQRVSLSQMNDQGQPQAFNAGRTAFETDDRGVYRVYGLPPGKYLVSAGNDENGGGRFGPPQGPGARTGTRYALTYHPDAATIDLAKIIEVAAGRIAENVNIRMGEPLKRYVASGRVVDTDTGQPLVGQLITATQTAAGGRGGGPGGQLGNNGGATTTSDANGNFILTGLLPGSYSAALGRTLEAGSDYYGRPVSFQIVESNVADLVLSLKQGASISGVVILDGVNDPTIRAQLAQTMVMANVRVQSTGNTGAAGGGRGQGGGQGGGGASTGRSAVAQVNADGTFRVSGLAAGRVTLGLNNFGRTSSISMLRIENNGAAWPTDFEITQGQSLVGLRIIAGVGNGIIRGQVVVQGATAGNLRMNISARPLNGGQNQQSFVDQQGHFRFDGLLPGAYELTLTGFAQGFPGGAGGGRGGRGGNAGGNVGGGAGSTQTNPAATFPTVRQTVTVANGVETPVVMTATITQ